MEPMGRVRERRCHKWREVRLSLRSYVMLVLADDCMAASPALRELDPPLVSTSGRSCGVKHGARYRTPGIFLDPRGCPFWFNGAYKGT